MNRRSLLRSVLVTLALSPLSVATADNGTPIETYQVTKPGRHHVTHAYSDRWLAYEEAIDGPRDPDVEFEVTDVEWRPLLAGVPMARGVVQQANDLIAKVEAMADLHGAEFVVVHVNPEAYWLHRRSVVSTTFRLLRPDGSFIRQPLRPRG